MDKGLFDASATGLTPLDAGARTIVATAFYRQKPVFVSVRTPRNPEFSALAHVVFGKIAAGIGVPMDAVKQWLKERTGRYDLIRVKPRKHRGKDVKVFHSLSFESMSEEQFRAFWTDSMPFIAELIGGFDTEEGAKILAIINGDDRNYRQ